MIRNIPKIITICIVSLLMVGLIFTTGYTGSGPVRPPGGKKPPPKREFDKEKPKKEMPDKEKPPGEEMQKGRGGPMVYLQKMKRKDAVIPLLAQLTHRYLEGVQDKNELDEIFERVLNRHPNMKRELLQKFVDEYNAIPQQFKRQKFVVPEVQAGGRTSAKAITKESMQKTLQKAYPEAVKSFDEKAFALRDKIPQSKVKKWEKAPFDTGGTQVALIEYVERPVINKIVNENSEPGESVEISGRDFQEGKTHKIVMTYVDYEGDDPVYYEATAHSDKKISFTLPDELLAGEYLIQVQAPGMCMDPNDRTPISEPYNYTVDYPKYKIYFNKMKCIDETRGPNNENIYKDSIVTLWGVAADERAWFVHSKKYKHFEDGTTMVYDDTDKTLLTPDGNYTKGKYGIVVEVDLYEWNWTDVESGDCEEVVDWTYDWFEEMNTGGMWGIGYIFDLLNMLISPIINFFVNLFTADPRLIEVESIELSYLDLQEMLDPGKSTIEKLNFKGQDGEYELTYSIHRK